MRWRKLLLAVVVFLVVLELALQLGALVVARTATAPPAAAGAVLCVGDSFTFGVGASGPAAAYPARLQEALAALGRPGVAVANAGFPGQHSGDVLTKLPGQLGPGTRVVCVLVGANDLWRHPARIDPAKLAQAPAAADGFQWHFRTWRLVQMLTGFQPGMWQEHGEPPPPAGAGPGAATGPVAVPPTAEDRAAGFRALAACGLPAGPRVGRYEPDRSLPNERNDAFRRAMLAGDVAAALAEAERSVRECPTSPLALQQVVTAAVRLGRRERALAAVDALAALLRERPDGAVAECLIEALSTTGQPERAAAAARERIAAQPLSILAWDGLQRAAIVLGRRDDALRAMPEVVRLAGTHEPERAARVARDYARCWFAETPDRAVGLLLGAHLIDGDVEESRMAVGAAAERIPRERFAAALQALGAAERPLVRSFAALVDEVFGGAADAAWTGVLVDHLRAIGDVARAHGASLVIVGYPFWQPALEGAQRRAAAALGVPFVAVRERIAAELQAHPERPLFSPDGHCNDAGYAIVAELVAAAVAQALR